MRRSTLGNWASFILTIVPQHTTQADSLLHPSECRSTACRRMQPTAAVETTASFRDQTPSKCKDACATRLTELMA